MTYKYHTSIPASINVPDFSIPRHIAVRIYNALRMNVGGVGPIALADTRRMSDNELLSIVNIGKGSLSYVRILADLEDPDLGDLWIE